MFNIKKLRFNENKYCKLGENSHENNIVRYFHF